MRPFVLTVLAMCLAGFLGAQDVTVKSKTKINTDFSKYRTFAWTKPDATVQPVTGYDIYTYEEERLLPPASKKTSKKDVKKKSDRYVYSYNVIIPSSVASVNDAIQSSITDELEARGYREQPGADLLVAYRVLERQARMKGFINDSPTMVGATEVRTPADTTTFTLEPGTLIISLIDAKTSEVVWDGFASGLVNESAFITDDIKIKEAVHLILEEFEYRGDKVKVDK